MFIFKTYVLWVWQGSVLKAWLTDQEVSDSIPGSEMEFFSGGELFHGICRLDVSGSFVYVLSCTGAGLTFISLFHMWSKVKSNNNNNNNNNNNGGWIERELNKEGKLILVNLMNTASKGNWRDKVHYDKLYKWKERRYQNIRKT